jgi:hypothetical protein
VPKPSGAACPESARRDNAVGNEVPDLVGGDRLGGGVIKAARVGRAADLRGEHDGSMVSAAIRRGWLLSDASGFVTGHALRVDGGGRPAAAGRCRLRCAVAFFQYLSQHSEAIHRTGKA